MTSRDELIDRILELQDNLQSKLSRIEELEFQNDWFRRQVFGTKSERFVPDDDLQIALDLGIDIQKQPIKVESKEVHYSRSSCKEEKKKGHGRNPMPTHLPIDVKIIEPQEDVSGMVKIGVEESWYYDMEPASLRVVKEIRPKYAYPDGSGILIADLPARLIEKGNAGPGFATQVVIDKFVYHMPLDRQRKKFENEYAVEFSESWLSDIVKNVGFWIEPLHGAYQKQLLTAEYLCADETPIPVLVKGGKKKTHKGYFWVYYDPLHKITIFDYRERRTRDGPCEFLKDFKGILQIDGYDGYNEIIARNAITRAACMDHVRRRFEQALENDAERARYALDTMRIWYEVESNAKIEGLSQEERFARRVEKIVPSMDAFKVWLNAQVQKVLPKSAIGRAISYALNQWPYFQPFKKDPRIALSNIATENSIRPIAIGRKNYLFCGSHDAARRAAMIYSLIATAKNHGIDPGKYIKDILTRIPSAKSNQIGQFLIPEWKQT